MGKKWKRIDPAEIKVGDRVKYVDRWHANGERRRDVARLTVTDVGAGYVNTWAAIADGRTWYVRKPKPAKPLTRPDEPPVGTFFRVDRTGCEWERPFRDPKDYELAISPGPRYRVVGESGAYYAWEKVVEPGDTITALQLVEVGDKRDELFEATEKIAELERSLMDLSGGEW